MTIAYSALAALSALLLAAVSATGKLRRNPYIVRSVHEVVGVPLHWFPILAALELAGAAGLLLGILWVPVGIAAAAGISLYFVGAVIAHLRVRDIRGAGPALQMLCLASAALITRMFSA